MQKFREVLMYIINTKEYRRVKKVQKEKDLIQKVKIQFGTNSFDDKIIEAKQNEVKYLTDTLRFNGRERFNIELKRLRGDTFEALEHYWENGNKKSLKSRGWIENGKYKGVFEGFFDNGQIKKRFEIKPKVEYLDVSFPMQIRDIDDYYDHQSLLSEEICPMSALVWYGGAEKYYRLINDYEEWHSNGQLSIKISRTESGVIRDGKYVEYNEGGDIRQVFTYKNGSRIGVSYESSYHLAQVTLRDENSHVIWYTEWRKKEDRSIMEKKRRGYNSSYEFRDYTIEQYWHESGLSQEKRVIHGIYEDGILLSTNRLSYLDYEEVFYDVDGTEIDSKKWWKKWRNELHKLRTPKSKGSSLVD
tara:strand:+ start:80 stop:1156 length:1077 start_codon:yes stop_codon:yes gene_type:complete